MGLLEQLVAAIQANTAAIQANGAGGSPYNPPAAVQQTHTLAPPVTQPPPAGVTADQITALIQPHVSNDAVKVGLGVAMRALGINTLPEAPPHLYGQLYQAFQGVLAQHGIGGAAPAQTAASSII